MDDLRKKLEALQFRFDKLELLMPDERTRDFFLTIAKRWLQDARLQIAHNFPIAANVAISLIEMQLKNAEKVVDTYGIEILDSCKPGRYLA